MNHAVIMAGGKGERFWPESRKSKPKQFLNLIGNESMIQATVRRINKLIPYDNIYIVTNEMYKNLVKKQLPMLSDENIIIEPLAKNTAACIGLACAFISKKDSDASIVVLPSDHLIKNETGFLNIVDIGFEKARTGNNLVTLGIKPNYPETGYGYIKHEEVDKDLTCKVECFVEKPNMEKAIEYIKSGNYLWNSGMFIWTVETIMDSFKQYMPDLYWSIEKIKGSIGTNKQDLVIKEEFMKLESISIDYGVMERADNIYVIPCDFGWDDVGSWTSLERLNPQDELGNVVKGKIISIDTRDCIVKGDKKLIATIGIEDLIVVDTEDAILICKKDRAQDIKQLINEIKENSMDLYL
jgi:Mannose-1-phosphate guanylyltransferase